MNTRFPSGFAIVSLVLLGSWMLLVSPCQAQDGTLKWKLVLGNSKVSSPAIGDDGTLYLISLDPGDRDGVPFEWWLFVEMDSAYRFWYQWPAGNWIFAHYPKSVFGAPAPLMPLSDVLVASGTVPPASWRFYFAVDGANGMYEGTYRDTIKVNVY